MQAPQATGELYKTTIVIWSTYSGNEIELEDLGREATGGDAYCSDQSSERVSTADAPEAVRTFFAVPDDI